MRCSKRKLIKKGAKDKASGNVNYMISNAGKKHPGFQTGGARVDDRGCRSGRRG